MILNTIQFLDYSTTKRRTVLILYQLLPPLITATLLIFIEILRMVSYYHHQNFMVIIYYKWIKLIKRTNHDNKNVSCLNYYSNPCIKIEDEIKEQE